MNRRVLFALLVLVCVFSSVGIIIGSQWSSVTIRSGGNLKVLGVGVYKDMDCSKPVDFLDWGTLEPDSAKSITLYIRNEGSYAAALFMTVNNWNPSIASSYMSLSWNYDGEMLAPMETVEVILTLSVSKDVENIVDFSLDVTIKISE